MRSFVQILSVVNYLDLKRTMVFTAQKNVVK